MNAVASSLSSRVTIDDVNGVLIIDGARFSPEALTSLTTPTVPGMWMRSLGIDKHGGVTIECRTDLAPFDSAPMINECARLLRCDPTAVARVLAQHIAAGPDVTLVSVDQKLDELISLLTDDEESEQVEHTLDGAPARGERDSMEPL